MKTTATKTKLLAVLLTLCMVLSLVPDSAFAATPAAETADFTTNDDGAAALALLNAAKNGSEDSTWDNASKTLTLRGIDFTTTATTAMKLPDGATIILADGTENKITGGDATAAESGGNTNKIFVYGIFSNGALTIQGETAGTGTLSVTSGSHMNAGDAWTHSIALYGEGSLTVKGGTVTANGGKATGYDGGFSYGVHLAKGFGISVTGGSLIGIGGESLNQADPSDIIKTNSRGIYVENGNITVSDTGKLVGDCIADMYESELSTGVYILRGFLQVSDSGQVNATGGYGIQITNDGIKLTGGKITAACTATYNLNAIDIRKEYQDTGAVTIEVTGGVLETNGNINMHMYDPTDSEYIFSVTGGTVQTGSIYGVNKFHISGGIVRTQKITTNDLTLSNATLTVREPVLMYNNSLYTNSALHLKNLTVNSGVLDVAWDWGGYTPIVFPINSYDQFRTPLVRMWGPSYIAAFNGGTTILDTGCAGNFVIRGQIALGEGMTQTGADENQFQLSSDTPVKFSPASAGVNIINEVAITDAKFNYQPGDAPQTAAKVSLTEDADKYEILFECWEQMENNNPAAYWYSDDSQYTSSMKKITKFEEGKSYRYSIRLKAKDGYTFADNCPVMVNDTAVGAVNVTKTTDGLLLTAVKTITPTNPVVQKEIGRAEIFGAKFDYQPGAVPQTTAKVSLPEDADKYEILFECWEQMENDQPAAYWYSDDSQYTASMKKITQFEADKSYRYSIRLKAKDGYTFADHCPVMVNDTAVGAVNVTKTTDGLLLTAVKTITPTASVVKKEIKLVEINNATVSFKSGATPVFTGTVPEDAGYDYQCEWWEIDGSRTGVNSGASWNKNYKKHITKFKTGKTYRYGVYLRADEGYCFTADTKLKINGVLYDYKRSENDAELTHPDDMTAMWVYTDLTMTPQTTATKNDYKIIKGANGIWTQNTDRTLTFRTNGDFSKFSGIKVDGSTVAADQYTTVSDTNSITLKADYLGTLSVGKHTLAVIYTDGRCSTKFEIKEAPTDGNNPTPEQPVAAGNADQSVKLPKTGDGSNPMLPLILLLISSSVLTGTTLINRKKKSKEK